MQVLAHSFGITTRLGPDGTPFVFSAAQVILAAATCYAARMGDERYLVDGRECVMPCQPDPNP